MLEMQLPTNGQKNLLLPLIDSCPHIKIAKANKLLNLKMKLVDKASLHFSAEATASLSLLLSLKYERLSLSNPDIFPKNSTYIGYFQDVREFFEELPWVLSELNSAIKRETESLLETSSIRKNLLIPFQILHIRGGDFKAIGNEGFGLLKRNYYIENLDLSLKTLIITDDPEYAWNSTAKFISNATILNPDEFDEWSALSVSSLCDRFIGSNSTFSYWCALLANYNGATCLLPKPFNKSRVDLETLQVAGLQFVEAEYN